MKRLQFGIVVAGLAALAWLPGPLRAGARDVGDQGPGIASLTEPGEGLAIRQSSRETGRASFAAVREQGQGILLPAAATDSAADRASVFVDYYGQAFGLQGRSDVQLSRPPRRDDLGAEHVRFQQLHQGVPVAGGEFLVHLKGSRVMAANGRILDRLPSEMAPTITAGGAISVARQLIELERPASASGARYSAPALQVFNRGFLEHQADGLSRLAWFVEAANTDLREFIWIDAGTGALLLNFSQINDAQNRQIYNANGTNTVPGILARSEGQPNTGIPEVDGAYFNSGGFHVFFNGMFGRDGIDGLGGPSISTVNWNGGGCPRSFWNGTQAVFCGGFLFADDIVSHELTHGMIQHEANLFSYTQSGALSESYADFFGEGVDLLIGTGGLPDGAHIWLIGEDLPGGAIRNMANPNAFGDPGKMSDVPLLACDSSVDNGGVHTNSGIPSHAFVLMADGGTYNGISVTGINISKTMRVAYRAITTYLTTSSSFQDNFSALTQACSDLVGTSGITAADCAQVENALRAVEMNAVWRCSNSNNLLVQPAMCPAGGTPSFVFHENFETDMPGWVSSNPALWTVQEYFVHDGARSAVGLAPPVVSDHHLTSPDPGILIPVDGRLMFDNSFRFELSPGMAFDGGVIEYSTNNGTTWTDAFSLVDGGYEPNAVIHVGRGNPLAGRPAFTGATHVYGRTRLNLATLAGQTVRFRWRIGTDVTVGTQGWFLDDVRIYSCPAAAGAPTISSQPQMVSVQVGQPATFTVTATGNPTLRYQWLRNGAAIPGGTSSTLNIPSAQAADRGFYSVLVSNDEGTATSDGAMLFVAGISPPWFINQPESRTIGDSQNAQFVAQVSVPAGVTYQWQLSTTGGASWDPVPNAPPYDGAATTTLNVTGATTALNGTLYRLLATNSFGSTTSQTAILNVLASTLVTNGDFSTGDIAGWAYLDNPGGSGEQRVVDGVFEWNRPGNSSTQSVILQNTGAAVSGTPLQAQFDLGNSAAVRQRISVLMIDADFSDISVCTFWLEPAAPMRTYRMRTHTTRPWANAAIYFYAATTHSAGSDGGYLRLDNVTVSYNPSGSDLRTDCVDPTSPAPTPGAPPGVSLITNGDFSGGMTAWGTQFTITGQVTDGVFEFIRTAGLPGGVVLQPTGETVSANAFLTATFDLGNSSAVRKRVTLLIHANDFSDLAACTFWLPPGLPLSTHQMKMRATQAWAAGVGTGATFSLYGATVGFDQWIRLDNVSLQRTPASAIVGTECIAPGRLAPAAYTGARPLDDTVQLNAGGIVINDWASGVDDIGARVLRWKRPLQIDAGTRAALTFNSSVEGGAGAADVQVSLDGLTWHTLARVPPDEAWTERRVDLSEYLGHRIYVQFVFTALPGDAAAWRVGNVRVVRRE